MKIFRVTGCLSRLHMAVAAYGVTMKTDSYSSARLPNFLASRIVGLIIWNSCYNL